MSRIVLAFKSFFSLLFSGRLPEDVLLALNLTQRIVVPTPSAASAVAKPVLTNTPSDGAVQILSILQRDARLIDFFMEDIGPFTDEQVGSVVRDVHKNSREVLQRHVTVSPVIDAVEETVVTLKTAGLSSKDTTRVKVVGKVPPDGKVESGVLRHRGWKVDKIDLPTLKAGDKLTVIAPAEIEVE